MCIKYKLCSLLAGAADSLVSLLLGSIHKPAFNSSPNYSRDRLNIPCVAYTGFPTKKPIYIIKAICYSKILFHPKKIDLPLSMNSNCIVVLLSSFMRAHLGVNSLPEIFIDNITKKNDVSNKVGTSGIAAETGYSLS